MDAPLFQELRRLQNPVGQNTVGQQGDALPLPEAGQGLRRGILPVGPLPSPGIADGHGAFELKKGPPQHAPQLREAGGTEDGIARQGREKQGIKAAVVGLPVGSHQARPVHAQDHMELLQGHVVDQHVIASLQKGGVHGKDRQQTPGRHARRHGDTMSLGNAHVKEAVRKGLGEAGEACAVGHGGGHGADPGILPGEVRQGLAEDGGKTLLPRLFQKAALQVKGPHAVVHIRVPLRKRTALPLDGVHMDHDGTVQFPGPVQGVAKPGQVVAVHRAQVGKAHVLKQGAPGEQAPLEEGLHLVVETVKGISHGPGAEEAPVALFEMVIPGPGPEPGQVGGHGPHIGVDGHAVVVQNHDQGLAGGPGVIQPLIGQSPGEGPVADKGQDAVVLPPQGPGPGHAQGYGNRVGGVPGDEGVVDALMGLGKAGEAVQLAEGSKPLPAARQHFVDVALVAHVEDQAVPLRVKHPVDGHRQLHRPQVGGQVPPSLGDALYKKLPQLLAELGELALRQRPDVGGRVDGIQKHSVSSQWWNRYKNRPAQ